MPINYLLKCIQTHKLLGKYTKINDYCIEKVPDFLFTIFTITTLYNTVFYRINYANCLPFKGTSCNPSRLAAQSI